MMAEGACYGCGRDIGHEPHCCYYAAWREAKDNATPVLCECCSLDEPGIRLRPCGHTLCNGCARYCAICEDAGKISVQLVCVHVDEDGTETMELMFSDGNGRCGSTLEVRPDGTMRVVEE